MAIDQQYLKSQSGHPDDKGKNMAANEDNNSKQPGSGKDEQRQTERETYSVEHFKALADQKNELKDEGMHERHSE